MLEMFYGTEVIVLLALASVWFAAALMATNLKHAAIHQGKLDLWKRLTQWSVRAGLLLFLVWLILELVMALVLGWLFAADRIVISLPLLLASALSVMILASPKLKHVSRGQLQGLTLVLVPIQTTAAAAVLANGLVMFVIPAFPNWLDTAYYFIILLAFAAVLWIYQRWSIMAIRRRRQGVVRRIVKSAGVAASLLIGSLVWLVVGMEMSKLPETMAMVHHETVDYGGGPPLEHHHAVNAGHAEHHGEVDGLSGEMISVADLTGPQEGRPDKRFTLEAQKKIVQLSSGAQMEAWTFNGQFPGPTLVVNEGDLVEVRLVNKDIEAGVTLHWHGVDVPNAEDGVAGMTQNAVRPGETYTYRFRVHEKGTHWYHSHQVSSIQVQKGLFGAFNILPKEGVAEAEDLVLFAHDLELAKGRITTIDLLDTLERRAVEPGTNVRLRLINSSSETKDYVLHGVPYRVAAIDGHDMNKPEETSGKRLSVGGGGRYDVVFAMPDSPVSLGLYGAATDAGIVFSSDGQGEFTLGQATEWFDPYSYGSPAEASFTGATVYDRHFTMILDMFYFGFYNGLPGATWAINGEVFPNVPTFMVEEGDIVKTTVVNRTFADHPMHLHGHHIEVLSRNGKPIMGSPLVLDTLLVRPGETYEYAFVANNPGLWMDHCHNLEHAALGMSMHLAYSNVMSPFELGGEFGNFPE